MPPEVENEETTNVEEGNPGLEAGETESTETEEGNPGLEAGETESTVISFEDEEPPKDEPAPEWVRNLRKDHRETKKKLKEAEKQLAALQGGGQDELGPKPTLEGCNYDSAAYEKELETWHDKKRKADERATAEKAAEEQQQQAWQNTLNSHQEKAAALNVADFDESEDTLKEVFSIQQQAMIIDGAENSAALVYALGKHPKKAAELAAIKNPVKFAFAVAKLETKLRVTNRKPSAPPEATVNGKGHAPSSSEAQLEKLREKAAKTGDFTEVNAYRRQMRRKQA